VVGVLGLIWIVPWWILARAPPERHPWVSPEERAHILGVSPDAPAGNGARGMTWVEALGHRQTWSVVVSRFFLDPIWWLFVNWLPIYLAERFGFDVREIGFFAWVPYLGAAVGSIAGGWYSGRGIRLGWSVDRARKRTILIGCVMALPGFVFAAFAANPWIAVLAMALVLCGFQVAIGNIQTLPSDFFAGKSVGTVAGLGGFSAVGGVLVFSTWLVPAMSRVSYAPVFLLGAALVPLAYLSVLLLAGRIRRVDLPAQPFVPTSAP
jgi:ACS family hexuronate transporter-like MFS transporter